MNLLIFPMISEFIRPPTFMLRSDYLFRHYFYEAHIETSENMASGARG
jgi:hypothetical protein